jgi:acetyl/propionyl-CoA carboxylase alpha subunit
MSCPDCTPRLAPGAIEMMHVFQIGSARWEAALAGSPQARRLLLGGEDCRVSLEELGSGATILRVAGERFAIRIAGTDERRFIHIEGEVFEVALLDPLIVHAHKEASSTGLLARAPMPGCVVACPVVVGMAVRAGDSLVIIESMKLEVAIKAERAGIVRAVHFDVGRTFEKDSVLVTLAAANEDQA